MAYPSTVSSFTNPQPTDRLNSPSHSSVESAQNTGLTELQTFVGTLSSTAGTLIYDIRAAASNGGGHVQGATKGGTGQTTFNKGDILIATNSTTIAKLAVGFDGSVLVANSSVAGGINWSGVPIQAVRVYGTASVLTWNKPSVLSYIIIETIGGGGGGGGSSNSNGLQGHGGGGGGYSRKKVIAASLGATETVTIGAGGTAGSAASNDAGTGGTTSFGAHCQATGGAGGNLGGTGTVSGAGGVGSGGDINIAGSDGMVLIPSSNQFSYGGASHYAGSKKGIDEGTEAAGNNGNIYGGGASGGNRETGTSRAGGVGGVGVCIVSEY